MFEPKFTSYSSGRSLVISMCMLRGLCYFLFHHLGHHSKVTISLDQKDDRTELKLIQTGIPEEDFERTKEGWKQFYFGNMKRTFCWGMKYF